MSEVQQLQENQTLLKFLDFLARDIEKNPQNIKPISFDLFKRVQSLTIDLEVDMNAPLSEEDE